MSNQCLVPCHNVTCHRSTRRLAALSLAGSSPPPSLWYGSSVVLLVLSGLIPPLRTGNRQLALDFVWGGTSSYLSLRGLCRWDLDVVWVWVVWDCAATHAPTWGVRFSTTTSKSVLVVATLCVVCRQNHCIYFSSISFVNRLPYRLENSPCVTVVNSPSPRERPDIGCR
ncbi:hypothetical protein BJV78DRAFT_102807 [Lactifluus subvellereus]|nr:hypothetical protein BJV78DRAFT_102807 [Lactifluus subvellereus]